MGLVNRILEKLAVAFVFALVALYAVSYTPYTVSAQSATEVDDLNRADPCALAPDPGGNATGIERRCGLGASSGVARGDFNGDGIADLAIGVPDQTLQSTCCFNGTSFQIVDHPGAGAVNIVYGSSTGLTSTGSQTTAMGDLLNDDNAHYGRALAAGNFRGAGFASDLAVGVPGERRNGRVVGAIAVHFSKSGKLNGFPDQLFYADQFTAAGSALGDFPLRFPDKMSMTWGDFNGDGVGDLAVSASTCNTCTNPPPRSAVLVLFGVAGAGLSGNNFIVLAFDDGLSPNNFNPPTGCFGSGGQESHFCAKSRGDLTVAAGDLNADGRDELLIGAPGCFQIRDDGSRVDTGTDGCVAIVRGRSGTLDRFFNWNVLRPEHDIDDRAAFGSAIAIGDFDADGVKDVAVGAPNNTFVLPDNAGMVRVFADVRLFGSNQDAGFTVPSTLLTQNSLGIETSEANDRFGASLATKDFNGDGAADLAIGAPGESSGNATSNGQVDVIFGLAGTGLSALGSAGHPAAQVLTGLLSSEAFGSSLSAWNFGKTAEGDLAIAAPFRNLQFIDSSGRLTVISGAGAVRVLYGSAASSSPLTGSQTWTQSFNGTQCGTCTKGTAAAGNHFGKAIY